MKKCRHLEPDDVTKSDPKHIIIIIRLPPLMLMLMLFASNDRSNTDQRCMLDEWMTTTRREDHRPPIQTHIINNNWLSQYFPFNLCKVT
jgi:hypothetical protein